MSMRDVRQNVHSDFPTDMVRVGRAQQSFPAAQNSSPFESLDYAVGQSHLYQKEVSRSTTATITRRVVLRWVLTFFIGIITGMIIFCIQAGYTQLAEQKFKWINKLIDYCDCLWLPFVTYLGCNIILASFAATLIAFAEPLAAGSGVPEITSFLNGVRMPRVNRFKTGLIKAVSAIAALASGLPIGQEGAMLHCGTIVAAGITQGKTVTFGIDTSSLRDMRNDTDKRDFVNVGLAAGVAGAFGAPIGGTLFSLEQAASFWNHELTWRTFFCGMVSSLCVNFLMSGVVSGASWGNLSENGLLAFGSFNSNSKSAVSYTVMQVPFFIVVGAIGGLFGALFNQMNMHLNQFRMKYVSHPLLRFFEVILLAAVASTASFYVSYIPVIVDKCRPLPPHNTDSWLKFFCPEGSYNDIASMFFTTQDDGIKNLLHNVSEYSRQGLLIFFIVYFFLACVTYGAALPTGLFFPCILAGGAMGRYLGVIFTWLFPTLEMDTGTFAMLGAAALLGGVVRMTITLAVIMMETTNDIAYGLPIIITLLVSKWVGDYFNSGLYHTDIKLAGVPLLVWEAPSSMRRFTARDIMARPVICFRKVERVSTIIKVLASEFHKHNGFPVVDTFEDQIIELGSAEDTASRMQYREAEKRRDTEGEGDEQGQRPVFIGMILRSQLITLLQKKVFKRDPEADESDHMNMKQEDFSANYPREPSLSEVDLTEEQKNEFIDLTPFMDSDPTVVRKKAMLTRVFTIFRTLGLRHLAVVNRRNNVVGIITRHDLLHLQEKLALQGTRAHLSMQSAPWNRMHYTSEKESTWEVPAEYTSDAIHSDIMYSPSPSPRFNSARHYYHADDF